MSKVSETLVWLQDLTWQEVDQHLQHDRVVLVPCGSTEQHGPAGVLGVDTYVATGIVEDVALRMGASALRRCGSVTRLITWRSPAPSACGQRP